MFTGIIQEQGKIQQITHQKAGVEFIIGCQYADLKLGESIAVNGICLTVTRLLPGAFCCQLSPETLAITMAKALQPGAYVNLERALQAGDRFGGHFVLGHVDAVGEVVALTTHGEYVQMKIAIEAERYKPAYLPPKGSIAINGVSLTINDINRDMIELMLIPHTLDETHLSDLSCGEWVNIEYDYLAKIVARSIATNAISER